MPHTADYQSRLQAYTEGQDPITMQKETPCLLADLVAGIPGRALSARPAPGKWSVSEILAHMAEDELTASWRYRQMIENPGVVLAGFDQDLWARLGDYSAWAADDALQMFRLLREANLRLLAGLTAAQWEAHGVHRERGPMTVRSLCLHMAGHDRNHVEQIQRILRKD